MTASIEAENLARREVLLRKLKHLHEINSKAPPVVELDEYFIGNTDEESIAPNAWGDGRPTIAEIYRVFSEIRARPDVSAVLVGLHPDWRDAERFGGWPGAENVHIYSRSSAAEAEAWVSTLMTDGIVEGWPYGVHPSTQAPAAGANVLTVCWD
jgi:hypothetical protein